MDTKEETFKCSRCNKRFFMNGFHISRLGERQKTCIQCNTNRPKCSHNTRLDRKCNECPPEGRTRYPPKEELDEKAKEEKKQAQLQARRDYYKQKWTETKANPEKLQARREYQKLHRKVLNPEGTKQIIELNIRLSNGDIDIETHRQLRSNVFKDKKCNTTRFLKNQKNEELNKLS